MPEMRFFARQVGSGSDLKVDVLVKMNGWTASVPLADLADGRWRLGARGPDLRAAWPVAAARVTVQAALRFSVSGNGQGTGDQSWQIDDILVDPYRSA